MLLLRCGDSKCGRAACVQAGDGHHQKWRCAAAYIGSSQSDAPKVIQGDSRQWRRASAALQLLHSVALFEACCAPVQSSSHVSSEDFSVVRSSPPWQAPSAQVLEQLLYSRAVAESSADG
jgi:hypothetical protein